MSSLNQWGRISLPVILCEAFTLSLLFQALLCNSREKDLFVTTESLRLEKTSSGYLVQPHPAQSRVKHFYTDFYAVSGFWLLFYPLMCISVFPNECNNMYVFTLRKFKGISA